MSVTNRLYGSRSRRVALAAVLGGSLVVPVAADVAGADGGAPTSVVRIRVVDQDGEPLRPAHLMACPVVGDAPDCASAEVAPTNRRRVARLRLERQQRYEFSAFVQDPVPAWACPGFALNGSEFYFSTDRFIAAPPEVPRQATLTIEEPSPFDCVPVTVTDENGAALPTAGMFVCPLAPDGTPCPGPSFDGPDPDGVIRLELDPAVTYRLQAFIVNTGWPCPAFVGPNGDTFHFSASTDLSAAQVAGTVFVIDRPEPTDCP